MNTGWAAQIQLRRARQALASASPGEPPERTAEQTAEPAAAAGQGRGGLSAQDVAELGSEIASRLSAGRGWLQSVLEHLPPHNQD